MSQTEQWIMMLIVEDHDFMRQMLRQYLQSAYPDTAIVEAADGARAGTVRQPQPATGVDGRGALPNANGIDLTAQVKEMLPETAVIIVSQHTGHAYITKDKVYRALGRGPSDGGHGDPQ